MSCALLLTLKASMSAMLPTVAEQLTHTSPCTDTDMLAMLHDVQLYSSSRLLLLQSS